MPTQYGVQTRAAALLELRRRRRERFGSSESIDPLARLLDPAFTDTLWEYEHSRLTESKLPGNLHPKQVEALHHHAKHRWLFWANQAGKTSLGAIDMALSALGRHPAQALGLESQPPVLLWASALSWELWENVLLPELLTWLPVDRVIDAPRPRQSGGKRDIVIRADNGKRSIITGKAAEQGADKYQAARIAKVWLDEEHPESVYNELQPRLLRHGGRTIATMTPLKGEATYVYQRIYAPVKAGQIAPERHWYSHAGVADNPGISQAAREELARELAHSPAQLAARMYGHFVKPTGIVYRFDINTHGVTLEGTELTHFVEHSKHYGMFDLGKWRFFFAWGGVDSDGNWTLIDEVFSQHETAQKRAERIHKQLASFHVKQISIWGECADEAGLREMNEAFERIGSPYRFWPVDQKHKNRHQGIERVESMLSRRALRARTSMGRGQVWRLGKSATSEGTPMEGSRFLWEVNNWSYPEMPDGKVQKDDPDDASADGADAMDATRYVVMQVLGPLEPPAKVVNRSRLQQIWADISDDPPEDDSNKWGHVLRQG